MGSGIHKTTRKNIANILNLLRQNDTMHIRGMSRALGLNPFVVSNIIDKYLDYFVDIRDVNEFGFRVKLISLKRDKTDATADDVLKYIEIRKRIRNST